MAMENYTNPDVHPLSTFLSTPRPVYSRIIIIENEELQRKIIELTIRRYLFGIDIEMLQFANAAEALAYLETDGQRQMRTALFLDLYMPVLNGWQFLDRFLDSSFMLTDIYILSSSHSLVDIDRAQAHPKVTGYLTKPLTPAMHHLFGNTRLAYTNRTN